MKSIDCRNWLCPKPVIEVRKVMLAAPDVAVCALVEDQVARQNLLRLASSLGWSVKEKDVDGVAALEFFPAASTTAVTASVGATTVVLVAAATMGSGNDELGRILLRNFLLTLPELEIPPAAIYFINDGVKLVVQGADTIEILQQLADLGIDLAACGLCLEFFGLKEKVAVGRITNMLDIVQGMTNAGSVLRP
ncbi:MAG: sulfurtransferase-like selenium metabolism protein YedF [Desulfuromonadales bacterium]|nr:sulfurtransferase-like selenium metabolism protein YedF [Desulfuromonadales bacterium]